MAMPTGMSTYFSEKIYFSNSNPFYTYKDGLVGQCTWYCWSKAHVKADAYPDRGIDVSHLPIGGAQDWIAEAENYYNIGDEPKADSIAVWRVSSKKGHVAYVETCDSNNVCYSEANWYTGGNPSWEIYVPKAYKDTIAYHIKILLPIM